MRPSFLTIIALVGPGVLYCQSLPGYLIDTFPAPNATGVPINANIVLRNRALLPEPPFVSNGLYTLKSSAGAVVSFSDKLSNCSCFATVLVPSAPLSPNTMYTFTVKPDPSVGDSYSFSFTTGGSADTTPPHLIGVDPPSGTTGVGLIGPFRFQFDKRLGHAVQQNQGVTATTVAGAVINYPSYSVSDDGTALLVRLTGAGYTYYASYGFNITVDPAQFVDLFGNPGQGAPLTANYTTFLATDSSGPHIKATLPADGDTGVVTNVVPRIYLDKNVDTNTVLKGIDLRAGNVPQSFTISNTWGDYNHPNTGSVIALAPSSPLAPNQTYTLALNSNLLDTEGFPATQPQTIQFTTGPGPDVVVPAVLAYSPAAQTVPPNVQILVKTNKPISPLVFNRLSSAGLFYGQQAASPVPVTPTLSPDGTLLTLIPQSSLTPSDYSVRLDELVDTSGLAFQNPNVSFHVSGPEDHDPPTLVAIDPPPGSDSAPLNSTIQLLFSEYCGTCLFPHIFSLTENGNPRNFKISNPNTYSNTATTLMLDPGGLTPGSVYTVSLSGVQDLAGNTMPDSSFSFTAAGSSTQAPPLHLLDSSPTDGSTGVDPTAPFVMHFDAVLNPVSAALSSGLNGPTIPFPVGSRGSGSTLTITPTAPLPANTTFTLSYTVTSVAGSYSQGRISFTTAASADTTRPQVTGISPPDGSVFPVQHLSRHSELLETGEPG